MEKPIAFVIMASGPEQQAVYEAVIKPAFEEELGWECWRAGERPLMGNLVRQIVTGIAGATLVVADLTELQTEVLYELGIAHALGNNVLTLFQAGQGKELPFDLRSYRYIEYANTLAGARTLTRDLVAAVQHLAEWSSQPSNPVQDFLPVEQRTGASASAAHMPTSPRDENALRELGYAKELAVKVRQRLHYVQMQQVQAPDPGHDIEAADLEQRLRALRTQIADLERQM
jgi:hypothetical protein